MDVEVRFINIDKGKGLFAKRSFKKGDIIFEEDPLVCCQFSWNIKYAYRACNHCLKPLETAMENAKRLTGKKELILPHLECCTTKQETITPCPDCQAEYCSVNCKDEAFEKYHRTICTHSKELYTNHPLALLNDLWMNIHLPPESNTVMMIPRILATIHQSPNKDEMLSQFLKFSHQIRNEEIDVSHKLAADCYKEHVSTMHQFILEAIPTDGIEPLTSIQGFYSLLALLGRNGQGIGTSAISQWVKNTSLLQLNQDDKEELDRFIDKLYEDMEVHTGNFLNNEGVGLYSIQSCCNHNCVPNAEPAFLHNNGRLSLVALNDIEQDEEICISYLDECTLERSRYSRRKELKSNYLFLCNCPKCEEQAEEPDITSEEEDDDDEEEEMSD